ncbi:hypothetical protein GCM10028784_38510 [Myceligenerans cantabricum]
MSIRKGASVCQLRAVSSVPRVARTVRAPSMGRGYAGDGEAGARARLGARVEARVASVASVPAGAPARRCGTAVGRRGRAAPGGQGLLPASRLAADLP